MTARAVDAMRRGHSASTVATDIDALLAHERGDDSDGPDVLVTVEPGGLSRVDWAAFPGEADDGHACTLSRMHGEDVVDQAEHIGPPVVVPRLDEGEHWRLEAFDARGRRVHEIHVDGRGARCCPAARAAPPGSVAPGSDAGASGWRRPGRGIARPRRRLRPSPGFEHVFEECGRVLHSSATG